MNGVRAVGASGVGIGRSGNTEHPAKPRSGCEWPVKYSGFRMEIEMRLGAEADDRGLSRNEGDESTARPTVERS
jgi:hypothetical protein